MSVSKILIIFFFISNNPNLTNEIPEIQFHNYETHEIETEDGYFLTLHRIPEFNSKKLSVLLVHGLLANSACYLFDLNKSLGYILAKQGYDVWLLNTRGTSWSQKHKFLDPVKNRKEFYNFSWHEIGYYDLPASIDYILNLRNDSSLYYIGHSQGGTVFLVMASTRPEYNKKIRLASLMAPASFFENQKSFLGDFIYEIELIANSLGIYDFALAAPIRKILSIYCRQNYRICENFIDFAGGRENKERIADIFYNFPEDVSLKQFYHYGQLMINGGFSQYDYGLLNLKIYGNFKPPKYKLNVITAPIALYYSKTDSVVNFLDVQHLRNLLPNVIEDISISGFNHFDFILAQDVDECLYNRLLTVFQNF